MFLILSTTLYPHILSKFILLVNRLGLDDTKRFKGGVFSLKLTNKLAK